MSFVMSLLLCLWLLCHHHPGHDHHHHGHDHDHDDPGPGAQAGTQQKTAGVRPGPALFFGSWPGPLALDQHDRDHDHDDDDDDHDQDDDDITNKDITTNT